MILSTGQFGIIKIFNNNTSAAREALLVYKNININGIVSLKPAGIADIPRDINLSDYTDPYIISFGYNESIVVDSKKNAIDLLNIINSILVIGEDAEKVFEDISTIAKNMFFQG